MGPSETVALPALSSPAGRWVVTATILGSGVAFLDASVVNVALPAITRELGGGLTVQQWVVDGYLLTLSALLLLGGALGDRYGRRRVFSTGLVLFTVASLGCGLAPSGSALIAARLAQGVGGALLVPGSLALINSSVRDSDRGRAVGTWAGLSAVASAIGPFVGGWLVESASWRWVFLLNVPIAAVALVVTQSKVRESRTVTGPPDLLGAATVTIGLAGTIFAVIEVPAAGWSAATVAAAVIGVAGLVAFFVVQRRRTHPLLPLQLFRSRQFSGANLTTFAVYAALIGALFLLSLQLQQTLGYPPLTAGVATLPITIIMLLLSRPMGGLAGRTGPRLPMTAGPWACAAGLVLLTRAVPGSTYLTGVLPGVVVFGIGLAVTVAPLTSVVLASVPDEHTGLASGVNNAVSRTAGLLAVAVLPPVSGLSSTATGAPLGPGFARAMVIAALLCVLGGILAACTVGRARSVRSTAVPGIAHACLDPCTCKARPPA